MNVVLVCIRNFQDYILTNIQQLLRLKHDNIFVLTNGFLFDRFEKYRGFVRLIDVDELTESYNYYSTTRIDKQFRNGFWALSSLRFFYVYEFMRKYQLQDIIHIENDVLIYYNCDELIDKFDKNFVYMPFDSMTRNIASVVYIPSSNILKRVLDNYDLTKDDMWNFRSIQIQTGLIQNLPIFVCENRKLPELAFVSQNYERFQILFDAAAMGQYLGGVDPRNDPSVTVGFVNETCVVKYNNYAFYWIVINEIKKPFIQIDGNMIPIFNLHVHCKNLNKFV